jgi:hypothetical protein
MGITFFEDDEILSFIKREMRGVRLSDEKPHRQPSVSKSRESRPSLSMLLKSSEFSETRPLKTQSSEEKNRQYRNRSIKRHLLETFMVGFTDKKSSKMYQSNVMKFANDNAVNVYRYYRKFLEDEENSWIDAELFEKALSGWSSTSDMQIEALERLEIAYANFRAETDHLSHQYNEKVYAINHRFEANFEQLKRLVEGQKSDSDKHSLDEIERSVNTINKELPSLFDEQRLALEEVIGRNEASKKKLELYFLETTNTIVKQSQNSASDNQLENNLFAVRRIKEHAKAISLAKQAVRKTFD